MVKICIGCEQPFEAKRRHAQTCSNACGKRVNYRRRHGLPLSGILEGLHAISTPKEERRCNYCEKPYIPFRKTSKYCSELCGAKYIYYHSGRGLLVQRERTCHYCQVSFVYDGSNRLNHCSNECARIVATQARMKNAKTAALWRAQHPDECSEYRRMRKIDYPEETRGGLTYRFFKRYPHIPQICQACGETRIVELAHKIPRNGAWRSMKNTTEKDVWILCPTCHRCLDYGIQTQT